MLPWPIFQPMVLANFITGGNTDRRILPLGIKKNDCDTRLLELGNQARDRGRLPTTSGAKYPEVTREDGLVAGGDSDLNLLLTISDSKPNITTRF
jgi:hypothetical protein